MMKNIKGTDKFCREFCKGFLVFYVITSVLSVIYFLLWNNNRKKKDDAVDAFMNSINSMIDELKDDPDMIVED